MAGRPYWSGQIKISLVSFGVQLFPATDSRSGVTFHQIDRETGQRIRHLNVVEGDNRPVENSEIVKGYEYSKGKYLVVEPDEIANLRIETRNIIDVKQFVDLDEIAPALFERPYFVVPEPKESPEAFAVMHKAMQDAEKAAIGEIAFGGREHLVAIAVSSDREPGMMAYTLRYSEELRDSREYFAMVPAFKTLTIDKKQLAMATQLIEAYSHPLSLEAFKDDYEAALRKLIEAKQENAPLPVEEKKAKPTKVINLMDALRQSVSQAKKPPASERRAAKTGGRKGPVLVRPNRRKHRAA
jgi:DNA end-binding protein Ku